MPASRREEATRRRPARGACNATTQPKENTVDLHYSDGIAAAWRPSVSPGSMPRGVIRRRCWGTGRCDAAPLAAAPPAHPGRHCYCITITEDIPRLAAILRLTRLQPHGTEHPACDFTVVDSILPVFRRCSAGVLPVFCRSSSWSRRLPASNFWHH